MHFRAKWIDFGVLQLKLDPVGVEVENWIEEFIYVFHCGDVSVVDVFLVKLNRVDHVIAFQLQPKCKGYIV